MATKTALKLVGTSPDLPRPPDHLGEAGRELWSTIMEQYAIADAGGAQLLKTAAEAADRVAECRELLAGEGMVLRVRGTVRAHPAAAIERDARAALIRALKELHLDVEPLRDAPGRPPGRA